ncbi:MAG: hypothetical protein AAGE52_12395 [Myxococcota bacterium]
MIANHDRFLACACALMGGLVAASTEAQTERGDVLQAPSPEATNGLPPVPPPPTATPVAPVVPIAQPSQPVVRVERRSRWRERFGPERVPGHRLQIDLMPFGSDVAGGVLGRIQWRYRSPSGVWTDLRMGPTGIAFEDGDRVRVVDAAASVGWEHRYFAFGLGAGMGYARIDEGLRRTTGATPTLLLHLRGGAEEGIHVASVFGATLVDGSVVPTHVMFRFRYAMRKWVYLDFDFGAALSYSYVFGVVALEMNLRRNRESPWRVRPFVGGVEVIDEVRRVGGPGLTAGVGLVYLQR